MEITYIFHSCFTVGLDDMLLVFDFFKDTDNEMLAKQLRDCKKPVYVFSSHFHADHFQRSVLDWAEICGAHYIFSSEIRPRVKKRTEREGLKVSYVKKGDVLEFPGLSVKAFGSTDAGVSYFADTGKLRLFHAGDLNNWHWREESTPEEAKENELAFERELDEISAEINELDLAMFPVDPRLGRDYMLGAEQFTARIKTKLFAPMHFGEEYGKANAFEDVARKNGCEFFRISAKGDILEWK